MALGAFISGCAGPVLSQDERAFFRDARPCGLILFRRNCEDREQVRRLVGEFHDAVGEGRALVLIDQEGGRVQRLGPPHWRGYPPARSFGRLYQANPERGLSAARAAAQLMGLDLSELGITVDCAPVLDVPAAGAHDVIGDRAYGTDPETVIALGRAVAEGLMAAGVLPVVKHLPGHGRAGADSHLALPVIEETAQELAAIDFRPFIALRDLPLAMTAHVLLPAFDGEHPATTSAVIMAQVIRGAIGFDGLVMSDDISMSALRGTLGERSAQAIAAGVDVVLHCNGVLAEMKAVANVVPVLHGKAASRFAAACAALRPPEPLAVAEAEALMAEVLAAA